ncbi:hypothetical protein JXA88_11470 [Candidatus Fermentibacteria bacterium]|nr:hypothetical protein [Candidatus Fermentibacteria bacterium]
MVREQMAQVAATSGVMGCCLLARDGNVLVNMLPAFLSSEEIHTAADTVVETLLGLESLEEGAWEVDMAFAEVLCVVRPVGNAILVLLCDPDANLPVLKLSMNVAAKRIAAAPHQEFAELLRAASAEPPGPVDASSDELLPAEAVRAVIATVRGQLVQGVGTDAVVDQILRATGLNLDAPTRPGLRAALNDILEKGIGISMGRAEATRWLNQLVKQHGLAKPGS